MPLKITNLSQLTTLVTNTNSFFQLPTGSTIQRPELPVPGAIRYNTDLEVVEYTSGSEWFSIDYAIPPTIIINPIAGRDVLDYREIGTATISGTVSKPVVSLSLTLGQVSRIVPVTNLTWSYTVVYDDLLELGLGFGRIVYASATDSDDNTGTASRATDVNFVGSKVFTVSQNWTVPKGVLVVSAVAVGAGWGGGGGLGWKNNISVTPGQQYSVNVGSASSDAAVARSYFISTSTVAGFGGTQLSFVGDGGGAGGALGYSGGAGGGGGGAGGYLSNGGSGGAGGAWDGSTNRSQFPGYAGGSSASGGGGGGGGYAIYYNTYPYGRPKVMYNGGSGGGVGLYGAGAGGAGGAGGLSTNGYNGLPGSGGSGGTNGSSGAGGQYGGGSPGGGGQGAVRIVWGLYRAYPSTDVSSTINET